MGVGLNTKMFGELQHAIQGLRQHERIHSRFNDLALLGEDDRGTCSWLVLNLPINTSGNRLPLNITSEQKGGATPMLCFSASAPVMMRPVISSYTEQCWALHVFVDWLLFVCVIAVGFSDRPSYCELRSRLAFKLETFYFSTCCSSPRVVIGHSIFRHTAIWPCASSIRHVAGF